MENIFYVDYTDAGDQGRFIQKGETKGIGPFISIGGSWKLPFEFSLNAMLNAALLSCKTDFSVEDDIIYTSTEYDEIFEVFSYQVGAEWKARMPYDWVAKVGIDYESQPWVNAIHDIRIMDDVDPSIISYTESDLTLHGFVGTVGIEKRF